MTRARCIGCFLAIVMILGGAAHATSVGLAAGLDPTGILLVNALTELPISSDFDLRAEVGFATGDMAGLMLVTASVLGHHAFGPSIGPTVATVTGGDSTLFIRPISPAIDPFLGLGVGVVLTPPPFSTGLVLEGAAGVRLLPVDAVALFAQVRYLVRWLNDGFTSGPVYEAGLEVRF
ncbi:MAG: hypothetical protein NTX23_03590 [Candidatus Bipolaricaulota bacterium]|nr:hypothetical protein [Candidatus Bipolaricaulota bacterium]